MELNDTQPLKEQIIDTPPVVSSNPVDNTTTKETFQVSGRNPLFDLYDESNKPVYDAEGEKRMERMAQANVFGQSLLSVLGVIRGEQGRPSPVPDNSSKTFELLDNIDKSRAAHRDKLERWKAGRTGAMYEDWKYKREQTAKGAEAEKNRQFLKELNDQNIEGRKVVAAMRSKRTPVKKETIAKLKNPESYIVVKDPQGGDVLVGKSRYDTIFGEAIRLGLLDDNLPAALNKLDPIERETAKRGYIEQAIRMDDYIADYAYSLIPSWLDEQTKLGHATPIDKPSDKRNAKNNTLSKYDKYKRDKGKGR
jgi:hypothetical protein